MPSVMMGPVRFKEANFKADTFILLCRYFGVGVTQGLSDDTRRGFAFGQLADLCHPEQEYWGRWSPETVRRWIKDAQRLRSRGGIVINDRVVSIRKSSIDAIHRRAFGYGAQVDPKHYRGLMVEKSDQNYKHDGRIVEAPRDHVIGNRIYLRLIDAIDDDGCQVDLRTTVCGGRPIACVLHRRPWQARFGMNSKSVELVFARPRDVFTHLESRRLCDFVRLMGMDFGELDVLRDRRTGQLVVVDVNTSPGSGTTVFAPSGKLHLPCATAEQYRRSSDVPAAWRRVYCESSEAMILGRVLKSGRSVR